MAGKKNKTEEQKQNMQTDKKIHKKPKGTKELKSDKKAQRSIISRMDWVNRFRYWWLGGISFTRGIFRVKAAQQTLAILIGIITVAYIMAAFYTQSGEFVVTLGREIADDGFIVSETTNFSERLITLRGTAVVGANNINISDIDRNVMNVDGNHNGTDYVAYTFYLKNETGQTCNYRYSLQVTGHSKGADKAAWVMVFKNNEMTCYAKAREDGSFERQYSAVPFPFEEYASEEMTIKELSQTEIEKLGEKAPEAIPTITGIQSVYEFDTVAFEASDMICSGIREGIESGKYDKYTVVIWIEGEDPDCVDDIIGGWIETRMTFTY